MEMARQLVNYLLLHFATLHLCVQGGGKPLSRSYLYSTLHLQGNQTTKAMDDVEFKYDATTSTTPLTAYHLDKSDNELVFVQDSYRTSILETCEVNTTVLTVEAKDKDATPIRYSLSGPENDYFHMNPLNGEVTLAKVLEYNLINRFELYAGAVDSSGFSSTVPVYIDIQDVDTMNPHFIFPLYEGSISENQIGKISTHPEAIKAVDGDLGINETVYYSISKVYPTEVTEFISIEQADGIISVNKEIDRETVSLITVEIKAVQQNNQLKGADSVVMITILDENDNTPQFSQSTYEASLPENSPSGSMILVLPATDKDQDGLSNGHFKANNTMFTVNHYGVMYFINGELDRELTPRINVQVWVFDALSGGLNSSAEVIINITDVNDNNPEFHNLPLHYTIPEGDYTDTSPVLVAKLNVTDLDEGLNGYVTISADAESGDKSFRVQENGNIFVSGPLDREVKDKFEIVLIASDRGSPPRKSFADALIAIQDINDNVPTFTKEDYSADLILNKAKAGDKIMSVSATDMDIGNNSLISYRFVQPHSGFAINEDNGDIFLTSQVSAISATNIVIPVIATDHGSPALSSTASVIINVSEGQTEFVNSNYSFSLLEGMPEGTEVGSIEVTAGPDVTVMYFVQTYAKVFSITESGTIVTRVILDREDQESYNVLVTAVDSQDPPNTAAAEVTITIMDVNDNSPVFSPIINLNVTCLENKNFLDLDNITATDVDAGKNGAITYTLENDFDSTFYINSSTGKLMNIKPLDAEKTDNYELKVIARDAGTPPLSSSALIHVTVQDVNDNSPTFPLRNLYNITVKENTPPHVLLNVSAKDRDSGPNAIVLYSFMEISNLFYIGEESGSISNLQPLDFEASAEHILHVIAYNPGNHQPHSTATVIVLVEDVNEDGPMVEYPVYHTVIWDGEFATGSMILDVNAKKENKNMDEGIHYSISGENRENLFSIANATGHIFLTKDLPLHSFPEYYVFTVTCTDSGEPPQSTSVKVYVVISSSNVTVPVFSAEYYIPEPLNNWTAPHTYLIQIKAFYLHSSLNYSIQEETAKEYFDIDPLSGIIRTKKLLKIEDFPSNVTVKAADSQRPGIYSEAIVHVTVINGNQYAPVFTDDLKKVTVKEEQSVPTFIAQVKATDNDPGKNGILTYSILNSQNHLFSIDATNGMVFATTTFDYENGTHEFEVFISAEDDGIPHKKQGYITLVIQVLDINDCEPVISPHGDMYVEEDAPIGTVIGQITATDEDSGDNAFIVYSLFDEDDQFDVDALLGNIFVKHHLDHEIKERSLLTLTAKNNKTAPFYQAKTLITVHILDENDNAPQFTLTKYFAEIDVKSPVGSPVITVEATDRDEGNNGLVEYSLVSDPSSTYFMFENLKYGKIITATNHLKPGLVNLSVVAQDRGSPPLRNMSSVMVNLVNKKKTLPVFSPNEVSTVLRENKPKDEPVYTFSAKNATGQNVTYRIVAGNDNGQFYLDEKSGKLWRTEKFYENVQPSYNITVEADTPPDTQGPLPPNMAQLQIIVPDIKEGPVFEKNIYTATIMNTVPPGFPVIKVTAKSRDSLLKPTLIYSLVDQSGKEFDIDNNTGQIVAANVAGKTGTFHFEAQVTDKNGLSAQAEVQIQVKSPSSSSHFVEIKINQTIDEVKLNIPIIHRLLENVLQDNVTISSVHSDPNIKQDTDITFKASGESNQDIIRKLTDNISTVRHKLSSTFGKPTDITILQPQNYALSHEAIIAISVFAVLLVGLVVTATVFLSRKTSQKGYEEASKKRINTIRSSSGDDGPPKDKGETSQQGFKEPIRGFFKKICSASGGDGSTSNVPKTDDAETSQQGFKEPIRGFFKKICSASGGDGSTSNIPKTDDAKTSQKDFKEASKGFINMILSESGAMAAPKKDEGETSQQGFKEPIGFFFKKICSASGGDGSTSNIPKTDDAKTSQKDFKEASKGFINMILSESGAMAAPKKDEGDEKRIVVADENGKPVNQITGDERKSPKKGRKQTLHQKMDQTVAVTKKQPEQNTLLYKDGVTTEKELAEVKISEDTEKPTLGQVDRDEKRNVVADENGKPVNQITGDERKSPKIAKKQTLDQKMDQTVADTKKQPEQNTLLYKDRVAIEKEIADVKISEDSEKPTLGQVESDTTEKAIAQKKLSEDTEETTIGQVESTLTTEKEMRSTVTEIVDVTISETVFYEDSSNGSTSADSDTTEKAIAQKKLSEDTEETTIGQVESTLTTEKEMRSTVTEIVDVTISETVFYEDSSNGSTSADSDTTEKAIAQKKLSEDTEETTIGQVESDTTEKAIAQKKLSEDTEETTIGQVESDTTEKAFAQKKLSEDTEETTIGQVESDTTEKAFAQKKLSEDTEETTIGQVESDTIEKAFAQKKLSEDTEETTIGQVESDTTEKAFAQKKLSEDTEETTIGQVESTLTTEKEMRSTVTEIVDVTISETVFYEDSSNGSTSADSKRKPSIHKVVSVTEEIKDGKELKIVEEKQIEYVECWESYESSEDSDMESHENDEIQQQISEFPEIVNIQESERPQIDGDEIKTCGGATFLNENE
ncbi:protocadherin Fat 4-like isoform X10 [Phyllobates terribilis]|uniref:protocadherin Fat 4-like isoform X10 n=1 Tax=Phyllobates terribilis TaxID=111132 RepID=UPI003CCAE1BF